MKCSHTCGYRRDPQLVGSCQSGPAINNSTILRIFDLLDGSTEVCKLTDQKGNKVGPAVLIADTNAACPPELSQLVYPL